MRHPHIKRVLATGATAVAAAALLQAPAQSAVVPEHAVVTCQSAGFYANHNSSSGPTGPVRTLSYGDKVGHTRGAHPVYNGWAATFDFGPNDWGYVRHECIGGYGSW